MKVSELKQIIKEEIVKVLTENSSKPTHKSKVDWYYINDNSDYPGPKGRTVPDAKGFDNPKKYKGTELYVKKEDKGYVKDNKFIVASGEREGNDVEFKTEHFEKISENSVNEEKYAEPIVMIQNIVDNWSDGGIDAEAAMTRIDKILISNYEDESGEGFDN